MSKLKFYVSWAISSGFGLLHGYKYCPLWDAALSQLISKYGRCAKLSDSGCTVRFGGTNVWIANKYYAYGMIREYGVKQHRPSLSTMYKLAVIESKLTERAEENATKEYHNTLKDLIK